MNILSQPVLILNACFVPISIRPVKDAVCMMLLEKAQALKSSQTIKNKVAKGEWHTSLAKRMHYDYKGIDLHGKWELKYATWLDSQNIKWIRCKESFEYNFENKVRHYTPDFYLTDSDTYIEIKGFKTEKDDAKWKQFSKKLIVLTKAELKELGII